MAYQYLAYNAAGAEVKGRLEVDAPEDAEAILGKAELTVISLKKERRLPALYEMVPTLFGVKNRDRIAFAQQLATLLESGVPLLQALRLLLQQTGHPQFRQALRDIVADLEQGIPLSQATAKYPTVFPTLFQRLLAVGEETGGTEVMLRRLATYLEKQGLLVGKIRKALSYPMFVVMVGVVAMFILLTYSLPALMKLFEEFQAQLPLQTRLLLALSRLAQQYGLYTLLSLAVVGVSLWLYTRTRQGALRRDALVLRLPILGGVIRNSNTARVTSSLATLLGAGLPLPDCLDITARTTGNAVVQRALQQVRPDLMAGTALAQAMQRHPQVFPPLLVQMVSVGEATGALHKNLDGLGIYFERETDRAVDNLTAFLEPAIVMAIGVGIGFVAISVVTPMYSIISQIR